MSKAEKAVKLLADNKMTVTTVESCTGGMVCSSLVDVPGASEVLNEAFVTYSNDAKRKLVGVRKSTLKKHGAVSAGCAKEMAKGAAAFAGADAAVSTTGIAGPDGGSDEKPVGLVYIGCFVKGRTVVKKFLFDGDRMQVRKRTTEEAVKFLYKCLKKHIKEKGSK